MSARSCATSRLSPERGFRSTRFAAGGGFELLDGFDQRLPDPMGWNPTPRRPGPARRATIRISPAGRQLAAVLGAIQPLRVKRNVPIDDDGWMQATFRLTTIDAAAVDLLSLSPHVEVLAPPALREAVVDRLRASTAHYSELGAIRTGATD